MKTDQSRPHRSRRRRAHHRNPRRVPAPAQAAADIYTPHGGPDAVLISNHIAFTFVEAGQTFACEQFDLHASLLEPGISRTFGTAAATSPQLVDSGCFNDIFGRTTVDLTGAWALAITGAEVGAVSPAKLTDTGLFFSAAGCEFDIAGEVSGQFDDSTGAFTPTGSSLAIADDPAGFLLYGPRPRQGTEHQRERHLDDHRTDDHQSLIIRIYESRETCHARDKFRHLTAQRSANLWRSPHLPT